MSSRSHLVPTPITDKNGVSTTRLKKPSQFKGSAFPLPAPNTAAPSIDQQERELLTSHMMRQISGSVGIKDQHEDDRLRDGLSEHSTDFLRELVLAFDKAAISRLSSATSVPEFMSSPEFKTQLVVRWYPRMKVDEYGVAIALIETLAQYPQIPQDEDLRKADEHVQESCIALMRASNAYDVYVNGGGSFGDVPHPFHQVRASNGYVGSYLHDEDMVRLVLDHVDNVEQILSLIDERGMADPKEMRTILEWGTPSLANGYL